MSSDCYRERQGNGSLAKSDRLWDYSRSEPLLTEMSGVEWLSSSQPA